MPLRGFLFQNLLESTFNGRKKGTISGQDTYLKPVVHLLKPVRLNLRRRQLGQSPDPDDDKPVAGDSLQKVPVDLSW